ncbi:TPA: capsular biosynthesis protein [Kluyvera ascorbata]|uniref:galactosyltransferase-related protein n=1 Tax=Kluyvera ascorbata TaxID=51288 RepID=UPI0018A6984B|nr:galactosyltransferase-related protein [Kluyvera ascorbata]BBV67719.1 capsular polysaccharide biosynthesis protein [Klebsiella sp. STW0522-44]MDU3911491.1 galactosyltransferase-related protein [Kluyvera ascorbata]HAT7515841.1 capsular biosynthesis protein [Kluyvera ascorbata]HCL5620397.1 capsular biosynthesis protein [Kluyvera ascorbata]HED3200794.1 capsular biosynthesis protein [Kluyvera ascorbata]
MHEKKNGVLTCIVPIDLRRRPKDIISRAANLSMAAMKDNVSISFGLNYSNDRYERLFIEKMSAFSNVSIELVKQKKEVNLSSLRNAAFSNVGTDDLVLLDVDIYPDFSIFIKDIKNNYYEKDKFIIYPCLYLSKSGSKALKNNNLRRIDLLEKYFLFHRMHFLHLASPSSITLMKKHIYKEIGGFNESYIGHGYEDFDFLIRLCKFYSILPEDTDSFIDKPSRSPLFAIGFRRFLGRLCFPKLLSKEILLHIYHDKYQCESDNYYEFKKNNFCSFKNEHHVFFKNEISDANDTLISEFINYVSMNKGSIHDYSIYFENKPGHIDRLDTFKRRLRFLLNG